MHHLKGILSLILLSLNTIFWFIPLIILSLLKLAIPIPRWRKLCYRVLDEIASRWISVNNFNINLTRKMKWNFQGLEGLTRNQWYLVVANHQTWVDIIVLQKAFNRKIPFLKFFLKKELIWVPLLGMAWWALDFPFMKRYSSSLLKRKPHLRGKDLEITRKACEKFHKIPVSIMNFVEGTRFSTEKKDRQNAPFNNLIKPKAGGVGYVLTVMGDKISSILNVTIMYPGGKNSFWDFLSGKVKEVKVMVEEIPVTRDILGNYIDDKNYRNYLQQWVNRLWHEKDKLIKSYSSAAP